MAAESRDGALGGRLSLLKLDLFLKGELDPDEMESVRRRLGNDPDAARYVREAGGMKLGKTWSGQASGSGPRARAKGPIAWPRLITGRFPGLSPGLAMALILILAAGAGLWTLRPARFAERESGPIGLHAAKGGDGRFEARMDLAGRPLETGGTGILREGEPARLQYRSMESRYLRVLFQVDGRKAEAMPTWPGGALEPATRWKEIPLTLPPAKEWRRILLWIVPSKEPQSDSAAARAIETAPSGGSDHVARFHLESAPALP